MYPPPGFCGPQLVAGSIFWQIELSEANTRFGSLFFIMLGTAMKSGAQVS